MLFGALRSAVSLPSSARTLTFSFSRASPISRATVIRAPCTSSRLLTTNSIKSSEHLGKGMYKSFPALRSHPTPSHCRFIHATPSNLTNSQLEAPPPVLPSPAVGRWLLLSSTLVLGIIVVGGVTRLTESGLSITEWQPITGVLPPLSVDDWMVEFEKYKATPEFKLMNHSISLEDFKSIFYMEWGHRVLGRLIGVVFVGPLIYFAARRKISKSMALKFTGLSLLIGAQGLLGWYMVKSGLEDSLMDTPGAVPRVSQYRLAAHLGMAFLLYVGMFGSGMAIIKDYKFANGASRQDTSAKALQKILSTPALLHFKRQALAVTALVFLTALSGAFVAGLDAGLLYNEFPLMGGRLAPPADELFSESYAKNPDKSDKWWRNIFENPTTVQFDHRVLAMTTYAATAALYWRTFSPAMRQALPPLTRMATMAAFAMANVQVALGISTLLYLVPVPLAASHQAGSVMLLSAMVHLLISMRKPSAAARVWRELLAKNKAPKA
ncbi:electron transfer protein 1 [Pholiota conissans]|uniref:Electron transfer protein 1 n=1 Tax=Pholiota conissans TaxID=109636 RepID=A0A9P6D3D8_9AGAR|nr:electron transfer protein 1 [Pholiota conissans]